VGWSPRTRRSVDDVRERVACDALRWSLMGINVYHSAQIAW